MAGFSDLSNELVLLILHRVVPRDLVSFCLMSKSVHHLAAGRLARHRAMMRQNHDLCNYHGDKFGYHSNRPDNLQEILSRVLGDPFTGHYVNSLDLEVSFEVDSNGFYSVDENCSNQQIATFESAIRSMNLPIHYQRTWLEALANTGGDVLVALLLSHTPNLEHLYIGEPILSNFYIAIVAQLASKASFIEVSLDRLKDVWLNLGFCAGFLLLAKSFMSLRSVTSLDMLGINSETVKFFIKDYVTLPKASSNVTHMNLSGQITNRAELCEMLEGCKNLADLRVELIEYDDYDGDMVRCSDIVAILRNSAEHSLTSLHLRASLSERDPGYEGNNPVDFTQFKKLREIDVEAQTLLTFEDKFDQKAVVGRLPQSLQRLCLEYGNQYKFEYDRDWLRALENPDMVGLPNLKVLQISVENASRAMRIAEYLSGSEERFGLDYVVRGGGLICEDIQGSGSSRQSVESTPEPPQAQRS